MKCRLKPIHAYPFDISQENNPVALAYTCLANTHTASNLEIQSHAYRYLHDEQQNELLVLILKDETLSLQQSQNILMVPFSILRKFTNNQPRTIVLRKTIEMHSTLLPKLQYAKEVNVYLNSTFTEDKAIVSILSRNDYVISSQQPYLDCLWLESYLNEFKSIQAQLQLSQCLAEHKIGTIRSYFRFYIQVQDTNAKKHFLFKNGVTKLNIKKIDLHPYNIYKAVQIDKILNHIYQTQPYTQLTKNLQQIAEQIVLLRADKDVGLPLFLHHYSQTKLKNNFYCIDCNQLSSSNQFLHKIQWVSNLESSIVLVRNIPWILQLYQAEQILNVQMKNVIQNLQQKIYQLKKKTHRHFTFILEHQANSITQDMLQSCQTLIFSLDKPTKSLIFKLIFNHIDQDYPHKDQIIQACHDKFGWEQFKRFLQREWHLSKHLSTADILKQIAKLVKQEQTDNLIEVSWDDVGGLQTAKEQIVQTILLPITHPEIFDEWIKPRTGLLFYGPPGTGKTLLGKCIAKQCKMSFISVKGPQLLNMYVGQSEKNVRQVFERAAASSPCIVFMDELDALVPRRGNNSDSHQVMDRIVAELLMQMDKAAERKVFIIGATNRPDLLDPSILRPGRFDKQIYLGITQRREDRVKILKAQTRHLQLQPDLDWEDLLDLLPPNFTGADFYGLTSKAVMVAADRTIEEYNSGVEHQKIRITKADFLQAAVDIKPSVSQTQLKRYEQLKKVYS